MIIVKATSVSHLYFGEAKRLSGAYYSLLLFTSLFSFLSKLIVANICGALLIIFDSLASIEMVKVSEIKLC